MINNIISIDQNGNTVSDTIGDELSVLINGVWSSQYWNGRSWVDAESLYLQQLATKVVNDGANEHIVFGSYGASVLVGAGGYGAVAGYNAVGGYTGLQVLGARVGMGAAMEMNGMAPPPITNIPELIGYWSAWFIEP